MSVEMELTKNKTISGNFISWGASHYALIINKTGDGIYIDTTEYPYLMDRAELEINGHSYHIDVWDFKVHGKYLPEARLLIPNKIVLLGETKNEIAELKKIPTQENVPKSAEEYFELSKKAFYNKNLHDETRIIDGIKFINYAIKLDPKNEDAWLFKGKILNDENILTNQRKYALKCFEKVLKLNPVNENALMESIRTHYWQGTLHNHVEICNRVLDINPNNYEAWFWKGVGLSGEMRYKKALGAIDKAIENNSEFIDAWIEKGQILPLLGRFQEAFECLDKAEKMISPNDEGAQTCIWHFREKAYREMGEYNKAMECHDKCLEMAPYVKLERF